MKWNDAFDTLRNIISWLKVFGIDNVIVDVGLVGKRDIYAGGVIFQAFVHPTILNEQLEKKELPTYDVIALGGCYDALIGNFTPPNSSSIPLSAVGVNFAIEKLVNSVIIHQLKPTKVAPPPTTLARKRTRQPTSTPVSV